MDNSEEITKNVQQPRELKCESKCDPKCESKCEPQAPTDNNKQGSFESFHELGRTPSEPPGCRCPQRYLVTLLTGVGMMLVYAMRTNVAVTAIALLDEELTDKVGTDQAADNVYNTLKRWLSVGSFHIFLLFHILFIYCP